MNMFERCVEKLAYAPYAPIMDGNISGPGQTSYQKAVSNQMLAYNCPSFNWSANLSADDIGIFQKEIGQMGYKFQFITLAGFHSLN